MRIKNNRGRMKDRRGSSTTESPFLADDGEESPDSGGVLGNSSQPISPNDPSQYYDQTQFETDKRAVYKHPLFPLLALLFEKCEISTAQSSDSPVSDSFHQDLEAFIQHQERDRKSFLANDPEVDSLMIKAIQVLRIHLLEMDKVQELCKDFCNRYITCLKGKMQSENLLRSDYYENGGGLGGGSSVHNVSSHNSQSNSPQTFSEAGDTEDHAVESNNNHLFQTNINPSNFPPGYFQTSGTTNSTVVPTNISSNNHSSSNNSSSNNHHLISSSTSSSIHGGGTTSPDHLSNHSSSIHGGTPLSQIGCNSSIPLAPISDNFAQNLSTSPSSSIDDEEDYLGRKKPKRGVLPKHATSIMRSWLFQHIVHPYPTEDEKRQIAAQTNLTLLQVNNWFINARRRILQPMLDASNPDTSTGPKMKKLKTHGSSNLSKPAALKYWPASIGSSGHLDEGHEGSNGLEIDPNDSEEDSGGDDDNDDDNDTPPGNGNNNDHELLIDNSDSSQP